MWNALEGHRSGWELRFAQGSGRSRGMSWDEFRREAQRSAAGLRALGVNPGSAVACVVTNCFAASTAVVGVWLAGGTVVSAPTLARGMSPEQYLRQLERICEDSSSELLLMEAQYAAAIPAEAGLRVTPIAFEAIARAGSIDPAPPTAAQPAFIQYSSGSTSAPRGCVLSAGAVERHLDMLEERLELDPETDRGALWLPLSHDLGFFGALMLCVFKAIPLFLGSPQRFLRSPATWFDDCHRVGATITAGPNFGLALAARAARQCAPGPSPMRKCVLGGDRIEASTLRDALASLGPNGLAPESLMPAYGLAEAVLAVTMTEVASPPRTYPASAGALVEGQPIPARGGDGQQPVIELVSAGPPLSGVELRIDGPGDVGEICIRSPSLTDGYVANSDATRQALIDGELHSRDLGFIDGGELYVLGRLDDMISVAGRKIWARDIETAVAELPAVRRGNCAMVDVLDGDRPRMVVMVETSNGAGDARTLGRDVQRVASAVSGVRIDELMLLAPGTLPKTPSGKISRFRCRDLALRDDPAPAVRMSL
jgi:acyl-CoA synthetase (AMP-forming)/AMP-acid ligase II